MKLLTILFGIFLLLITSFFLSAGLSESLIFADLVDIQWAKNSSKDESRSLAFLDESLYQSHVYGIVIDAGSTGTRIHVYKFTYGSKDDSHVYQLVEEAIDDVRPGLSSYASDPRGIRHGMRQLLTLARRRVPTTLTRHTHVTVRATAGLRLLPPADAEALLNEARECVSDSGFVVDRVDVMDGVEEALQAWVTVNYLLQRLHSPPVHSLGVMDLGGASTQITFLPVDPLTLATVPLSHRHSLRVTGATVDMYTHSYLGLGLMSARLALLVATDSGGLHGSKNISSPCVPHNYQGHWKHGGQRYTITSTAHHNVSFFDHCYRHSRLLVTVHSPVVHIAELRQRRFYLFSYFYDRVKDTGIDPDHESGQGGRITVDDYRRLALIACSSNDTLSHRKPFLCLDLIYIYALLKDGYRLDSTTSFFLAKKINNIELGWTLGVVFDLLYRTELV